MSSPKSSPKPPQRPSQSSSRRPIIAPQQPAQTFEAVDPIWLAKALALSLAAALVCVWLTICLLFYQGEWQLVLHPTHTIDRTPASVGLAFKEVRFDAAATGQPRLTAWWVPADAGAKYEPYIILYLHNGSGSLSNTVDSLARLHQAGINVFAIDYRGFGLSDSSQHPTEATMAQDTAAALDYLVAFNLQTLAPNVPQSRIIPYGVGLGASLAARLADAHYQFPVVILDNPDPDPTATAIAPHPTRIIPVRLLFRERFDIATRLATLTNPKLLIAGGPNSTSSPGNIGAQQILFRHAASPKFTVTFPPASHGNGYQTTLTRFLDEYLSPAAHPPTR